MLLLMPTLDLTPFGFTPTESLVYAALLRIGPSTGYGVARSTRLARANAYGALEGLVTRGAATRPPGRPARYRPTDPQALLAHLATLQGEALDRLSRAFRDMAVAGGSGDPVTREVAGARATANLVMQLVARAERTVEGVLAAELWRPTLPAWRRAAERARIALRVAGDLPADPPAWLTSTGTEVSPALVVDDAHLIVTSGAGESLKALWTSHPLLVGLARRLALAAIVVLGACRAAPIRGDERFPAGTGLRAQHRIVLDTRIRLIDSGPPGATPVLFIHGLGASMYAWRHTLPPVLAAGYRVIAFDNRGFGFTEDTSSAGYDNAAYVRLAVALLDSLGVSSAVVVGHSMGGAIAAELALEHPERVRGLVLMNAAGASVRFPFLLRAARWPFMGALVTAFRGRAPTARVLRSTYADPGKVTKRDIDQYYAPVPQRQFGRALRGVLREFRFDTLIGRLRVKTLEPPTLILWGAEDRWIPLREGGRIAAALPRAVFVVVPGAGHAVAEEAPDAVNRLLLDFLNEGVSRIPENVAWSTPSWRCSHSSNNPSIRPIPPRSAS